MKVYIPGLVLIFLSAGYLTISAQDLQDEAAEENSTVYIPPAGKNTETKIDQPDEFPGNALPTEGVKDEHLLFPAELPASEWVEFKAFGFSKPVTGVIYRQDKLPCCGVPLGGISTGCIDLDARGVWGMSTIFNDFTLHSPAPWVGLTRGVPRTPPSFHPFLGLAVGGKTWVLAGREIIEGGTIQACAEPLLDKTDWLVNIPAIATVNAARQLHYWGHYPIADIEYETDTPVKAALRAWSPFIPGDAIASNVPGAVFEVHLRNVTDQPQKGAIAFNFPGPLEHEARLANNFRRKEIQEKGFSAVMVEAVTPDPSFKIQYLLGVIDPDETVRFGGGLRKGGLPQGWDKIATQLYQPGFNNAAGENVTLESGTCAAVDFNLKPNEEKTVRYLLCWYAPSWIGLDTKRYTHLYASRYEDALGVARHLASNHERLLKRIINWQEAMYGSDELPGWLRDTLINCLALIAEDSFWLKPEGPLAGFESEGGFFGLLESPRMCPQIECIPCSWYGNIPIVYFFPDLALNTARAYKQLITPEGDAPFTMSGAGPGRPYFLKGYGWQVTLNGTCYVDLIDRLWMRTGKDEIMREFYETVKRATTYTMNLRQGPDGVISMPQGNRGMEWFEVGQWAGMCAHLGGLHLSQLRIAERMAEKMGDDDFARQCRQWYEQGSRAMEEKMWAGSYYLNFWEPETGQKSDEVMAYQLDGQWAADFHGLEGVFQPQRIGQTLETIKKFNVSHAVCGAVNFTKPDGAILAPSDPIAGYGTHHMFPPEVLVLAMTYMYEGQRDFGIDLARRSLENMVCRNPYPWDQPNGVRGDTGRRVAGTDYYQNMMLWSLPAAMAGQDLTGPCLPGGLVDRVLKAGQ